MLSEFLNQLVNARGKENILTSAVSDEIVVYQYTGKENPDEIEFGHAPPLLHFIFSLSGKVQLSSEVNDELAELNGNNYFMFSNPYKETKIKISLEKDATVLAMVMTMKALHEIFGSSFGRDAEAAREFMESYKMEKFFIEKEMLPSISVIVHQLFNGAI